MSRALVALSAALALSARRVDANDVVDDAARTRDALTSRLTTKTVRLERFATDLESLAANDYDEYAASSGYFALNRTTKDAHMFYTFTRFLMRAREARRARTRSQSFCGSRADRDVLRNWQRACRRRARAHARSFAS